MIDVLIANASSEDFLNSFGGYIPHHFMSTSAFNPWFETEITRLKFHSKKENYITGVKEEATGWV